MPNSLNNGIPFLPEGVLDPSAATNIAVDHIDALLQLAVLNIQNDPPGAPADGDRYIVLVGTGAWVGENNRLARWDATGGVWQFFDAVIALNLDNGFLYKYDGSSWSYIVETFSSVTEEPSSTKNLVDSDKRSWILCSNASPSTITIQDEANHAYTEYSEYSGRGSQANVIFAAENGNVNILVPTGYTAEVIAGSKWTLKRESTNNWVLDGHLVAAP